MYECIFMLWKSYLGYCAMICFFNASKITSSNGETCTYPFTAKVVGGTTAPQMTSQPVSSSFICSPLSSIFWDLANSRPVRSFIDRSGVRETYECRITRKTTTTTTTKTLFVFSVVMLYVAWKRGLPRIFVRSVCFVQLKSGI